jgi:DNA-binding MarR family transcriptional regulator
MADKDIVERPPFLDEYYSLWLLLSQTRSAVFKARHKRVGQYIHFNQAAALVTIWGLSGQITPAVLSRHLFLEPHSVSELIIRMEKKGLVSKRKDTERENIVRISITEKGREFCLRAVQSDFIHHIMSSLSEKQRKQLRSYLSILFKKALKELDMEGEPPLLGET